MGEDTGVTDKLARMLLITLPIVAVFAVFFIVDFCLFHRKKERSRKYRHLFEDGPRNRVGHSAFPGEVRSVSGKLSLVRSATVGNVIHDNNDSDQFTRRSRDVKVVRNDSGGVESSIAGQSNLPFHSDPDITNMSHESFARVLPKPKPTEEKQRRHLPFMLGLFARNLDDVT